MASSLGSGRAASADVASVAPSIAAATRRARPRRAAVRSVLCMVCGSVLFHLAPHAQQVAAPDLGDVLVAEAGASQSGGEIARLRRIVPAGKAATAVEIRSDTHVVDAGDVDDVLHVLDVVIDGRRRKR